MGDHNDGEDVISSLSQETNGPFQEIRSCPFQILDLRFIQDMAKDMQGNFCDAIPVLDV